MTPRRVKALLACAIVLVVAAPARAIEKPSVTLLPPARGLYHAAFPGFPNEDVVAAAPIARFERKARRGVAWVYFSQNWGRGMQFPKETVAVIRSAGSVPFIRLMPRSGYEQGIAEPRFTLQRIAEGAFDHELARWADDARDSGGPLLVEFGTEVNGFWFPWNGRWNGGPEGPRRFRLAYRHIVDVFRGEGANNITWFFHVNALSIPAARWNTMAAYYPGDDYVDWIGVSVYGATDRDELAEWPSFRQIMDTAYDELAGLSPQKPLAVLELSVVEDRARPQQKAAWIRDAFIALAAGAYPRVKAVAWWNERFVQADGFVADLRIDSSPSALEAYRRAVASPLLVTRVRFSTNAAAARRP